MPASSPGGSGWSCRADVKPPADAAWRMRRAAPCLRLPARLPDPVPPPWFPGGGGGGGRGGGSKVVNLEKVPDRLLAKNAHAAHRW